MSNLPRARWLKEAHVEQTYLNTFRFTGISLPYGVGMLELEDFVSYFVNFYVSNVKTITRDFLDSYPWDPNLY